MSELHCTTCDAIIPAGSVRCPGCGLQLTTSAAPAVYVERARWPFWPVVLGAIFLLLIVFHELDRQAAVKASSAKEAFISDWSAGKLNSVEAFTARCGQPRLSDGQELHYTSGAIGDFIVTIGKHPRFELDHERGRTRVPPEILFAQLHCK